MRHVSLPKTTDNGIKLTWNTSDHMDGFVAYVPKDEIEWIDDDEIEYSYVTINGAEFEVITKSNGDNFIKM